MGKLKTLAIAGTFDRLHKGHEEFISRAFEIGDRVIVGVTSDEYARRKFQISIRQLADKLQIKTKIQNYQTRLKELKTYLGNKKLLDRAEIVKINDVYGPACRQAGRRKDSNIEALVATQETLAGARLVNRKRRELGLRPLKILTVPLVLADDRRRISSMRIRMGEIDREGRVYKGLVTREQGLGIRISEELRQELKKPQGIFIEGDPEDHKKLAQKLKETIAAIRPVVVSTIGDEVTKMCNEIGIIPHLAVFDYKVNRKIKYRSLLDLGFTKACYKFHSQRVLPLGSPKSCSASDCRPAARFGAPRLASPTLSTIHNSFVVRNPPGCITATLIDAVRKAYKRYIQAGRQQLIKVIGEDDLAGVPAILLAPLGAVVLYGQPGEGVVVVEVTEEKKRELAEKIHQFRVKEN